ncbi:hypothetical protein ABZS94_34865 [Streptomyces sp. NPDC005500]|uniref:hypothetical protein n=1 Tax=Streptomyces sp. NPDC005500 TaxID=3155007 RepID=UPI0033B99F37
MLKNLPTTAWIIGATVAVAALTPVVGQVATTAPVAAPAPVVSVPQSVPVEPAGTPQPSDPPTESATPSVPTGGQAQQVTVQQADTSLGSTAVDSQGRTLYLSVLDSTDPPTSVCLSDQCLTAWKPLYLPDAKTQPIAGNGIDQALLGSLKRKDGTWQATLGGWPLYLFDKDRKPGDVAGEGLKGTWHAIAPHGKKAVGDTR